MECWGGPDNGTAPKLRRAEAGPATCRARAFPIDGGLGHGSRLSGRAHGADGRLGPVIAWSSFAVVLFALFGPSGPAAVIAVSALLWLAVRDAKTEES